MEGRIIRLKDGAQAYTATFYGQSEVAKKNPKKIFLSLEDGGNYERIFSAELTAEKMIIAHKIKTFVDDFVRKFSAIRRKVQASDDIKAAYTPVLGDQLAAQHSDIIHQVMAQCSLFLCGTLFKDLVELQGKDPSELPEILSTGGSRLIQEHLLCILDYAGKNKDKADRSWPVLLKSNQFFVFIMAYLAGIRKVAVPGNGSSPSSGKHPKKGKK